MECNGVWIDSHNESVDLERSQKKPPGCPRCSVETNVSWHWKVKAIDTGRIHMKRTTKEKNNAFDCSLVKIAPYTM